MRGSNFSIKIFLLAVIIFLMPNMVFSAVFTVTNTGDVGTGSLRQAIINAEGNSEADIINVAVTGTIFLFSNSLTVTTEITIGGF